MTTKKIFLSFLAMMLAAVMPVFAADLNSDQTKIRSEVLSFLKQEGYMPEIDSDGDIKFKREGRTMYVSLNANDTSPMFISLSLYYSYSDEVTRYKVEQASLELNRYKGVKVLTFESNYVIRGEMYIRDAQAFCKVFYKLATQIENVREDVSDECAKISDNSGYSSGGSSAFNKLPVINNVTLGVTTFNQIIARGIRMDGTCDSAMTDGIWYHTSGGSSNSVTIKSIVIYKNHGGTMPSFMTNAGISWTTSIRTAKNICTRNGMSITYNSDDGKTFKVQTPQGYYIMFSYDDNDVMKWIDFSI